MSPRFLAALLATFLASQAARAQAPDVPIESSAPLVLNAGLLEKAKMNEAAAKAAAEKPAP